jgi:hypothetical protein
MAATRKQATKRTPRRAAAKRATKRLPANHTREGEALLERAYKRRGKVFLRPETKENDDK